MSHTNTDESKKIPLGSGKVYIVEYTGTIPSNAEFEVDSNRLGDVKSGASIEYTPTFYKAKDDLGRVSKEILTEEEAILKLGLITWNANTLNKLTSSGVVTEAGGKRTIKIGGVGNQNSTNYAVRFVNSDPTDGDIRITVVGRNQAALSLVFAVGAESIVNPEFHALPIDDNGTLIIYEEDILGLLMLGMTLTAGATVGKTKVSSISPTTAVSNSLKYQIGSTAISVNLDDVCTTGWTALTVGTTEIAATTGQMITVVEVETSTNKAKKYGTITVIDNIG